MSENLSPNSPKANGQGDEREKQEKSPRFETAQEILDIPLSARTLRNLRNRKRVIE